MTDVICLNNDYSTTRRLISSDCSHDILSDEKFKATSSAFPMDVEVRSGGLRKKGYFKAEIDVKNTFENDINASPLITVITAVFNNVSTLEQTILSVIEQSYDNIEYIIIDGGSKDGSLDIIQKYEHVIDYWVSEPDSGIYDAWNKGVKVSSGTWIAFLGSDDRYLDGAIRAYVDFIREGQGLEMEYISSRIHLRNDSKVLRTVGLPWSWGEFRKYMKIAHVGSFHNKKLFEKHGLFDDSYKITGDYEFLLRSGSHLQAYFIDVVTVDMHVGGVSNANALVFEESARAKILTAGRNSLFANIEKYWALLKWKIRSRLLS